MAIYEVTAISIDPQHPESVNGPRTEEIDTDTNQMFAEATSPWQVEDIYEAFWNRLSDSWEHDFPAGKDKVMVISVVAR